MYNEEIYDVTETEEPCNDYLPGTLEGAYRQWKEKKRLEKLYGRTDTPEINMVEEGHFHYLPYGLQACAPLFMR